MKLNSFEIAFWGAWLIAILLVIQSVTAERRHKKIQATLWEQIHDLQTTPDYTPAQRIVE